MSILMRSFWGRAGRTTRRNATHRCGAITSQSYLARIHTRRTGGAECRWLWQKPTFLLITSTPVTLSRGNFVSSYITPLSSLSFCIVRGFTHLCQVLCLSFLPEYSRFIHSLLESSSYALKFYRSPRPFRWMHFVLSLAPVTRYY